MDSSPSPRPTRAKRIQDVDRRVRRTTTWIAAAVAAVVIVTLPVGYLTLVYRYYAGELEAEAEVAAHVISQVVNANPDTWRFQVHRLHDLLGLRRSRARAESRRVLDLQQAVVAERSDVLRGPVIARSAPLFDAGMPVGRVEIGRSLTPVLVRTSLVALFGLLLGAIAFAALRLLPLRALEGSEDRFQAVAQSASDAIILADAAGAIIAWNPCAQVAFGGADADLLGKPLADLMAPRCRDAFEALWAARTRASGAPRPDRQIHELWGVRQDGSEFPLELTVSAWRRGDTLYGATIIRDITERRRAEATLREREEQLREAQKMEAVGRLAGGVAHEFNNLLSVITGRTELLLDQVAPQHPLRREITLIQRSAERATDLTRQLLAFGRRQILKPRALDLNPLVIRTAAVLRRMIGEGIEVVVSPGDGLRAVKVDPDQLEQALVNLAFNARDAMPDGGRLTLATTHVELTEEEARRDFGVEPGPHTMLMVSDSGRGMDAETLAHVFEPFGSTKNLREGTGLRLATVYGIVKQSGGGIAVTSVPGQGTTFKICLPAVAEARRTVGGPKPPVTADLAPATVLLVEDEDEVRSLVRDILGKHGYRVLAARDPQEALRIVGEHAGPIALLLTDVVMPGMTGVELAERVTSARPQIPVLYMSGYTADALVEHGLRDRDWAFLQKPFTPTLLTAKVKEILSAST